MSDPVAEFSFRTREIALSRFRNEIFDLLVVGGGITGAAVARDASSRGLKVALVERNDFAFGTSSRSSKLIHGGLRYLESFEFGLVFEALAERALLLKTAPHMVRPLPFYMPVYRKDAHGRGILGMGLWLYDLLALFRTPGFHRRLSNKNLLKEIPFLQRDGLLGGFRYFDASMWDDVLAVETLRSASSYGAQVASRVEAVKPIWKENHITGFQVRDLANLKKGSVGPISLRAHRTVICAGPWTDQLGQRLTTHWRPWLNPSKGVHLVFDLNRIPIPGALVMSHPDDGRIVFVIPRPDYGNGVVIVGTTDGPTPADPEKAEISPEDVSYLMSLLNRYFPELNLSVSDILSGYVGVRPLMGNLAGAEAQAPTSSSSAKSSASLRKVSREHHIDRGPGGVTLVAGGKYTTHRKMAEEIVNFTLKEWKKDVLQSSLPYYPPRLRPSQTKLPVNPHATREAIQRCKDKAEKGHFSVPKALLDRYGAEALHILGFRTEFDQEDPAGFPYLAAQLRFALRYEMVLHLEDFYLRRTPLFATRGDHGLPWAEELAQVWASELGLSPQDAEKELNRLREEIRARSDWMERLPK